MLQNQETAHFFVLKSADSSKILQIKPDMHGFNDVKPGNRALMASASIMRIPNDAKSIIKT